MCPLILLRLISVKAFPSCLMRNVEDPALIAIYNSVSSDIRNNAISTKELNYSSKSASGVLIIIVKLTD